MKKFLFALLAWLLLGGFFAGMAGCLAGCSASNRNEVIEYMKDTKGELDANASTDGEFAFFFGTKVGIKIPITATAHAKNNPYAATTPNP